MTFALFWIWTFILIGRPQDIFAFLEPIRPAILFGVLTWASVLVNSTRSFFDSFLQTTESRKLLLFYAIMILGIPFAYHKRLAFEAVFSATLMNLLFFIMLVQLVDSLDRLKKIVELLAYAALFYGSFSLLLGSFRDGRFFVYGMMYDPNDIAYVLVSLLPFCVSYFLLSEGWMRKAIGIAGGLSSIILILYTGSRSGLLGLAAVGAMVLFTSMGSIKTSQKLSVIISVLVVVVLIGGSLNVERYLSITSIDDDYNVSSDSGRIGIWTKAVELLLQNPVTGVGVRCFPMAIGYFRESLQERPLWQAAHNSYIEIVVETGVFGFAVFLSLIGGSVRSFMRGWSIDKADLPTTMRSELRILSGLIQIAFVGHLICAFFLSQGYSIFFILFFGLSAVIRQLTAVPVLVKSAELSGPWHDKVLI